MGLGEVGCEGRGAQALRIRILRPLRVRFIVEELSATEMRSYSKTDYNKQRFMSVIKSSSGTQENYSFGTFTLPHRSRNILLTNLSGRSFVSLFLC